MKIRLIPVAMLALVVGLVMLSATPAVAQQTRLLFGNDQGVFVPATDQQLVRVTLGNPQLPAPPEPRQSTAFVVQFDRPVDPVTIGPGESFTYTLDPREVGVLVRSGLRHVRVNFRFTVEVVEGQSAPRPSLTIELLSRKTGALESFHAFPGFTGGVYVAAGDVN